MKSSYSDTLLSMPYGSTVGKIKIVSGHGTPVTWWLKDTTKSINELWIIVPENRPYPLFSSFFRSFIIFELLPLIEPAALRIPLQLTLLLWWYCRPTQLTHWLLSCVAQQLASDYIWAMHQIIAQTVAWAIDFSSKSLPSWQRVCNFEPVQKSFFSPPIWCHVM